MVMLEPARVALTSTPSIVASSAELTRPDSAATGACAEAANGNDAAKPKVKPKAKPKAASSGCMGSSRTFLVAASIGPAAGAQQARHHGNTQCARRRYRLAHLGGGSDRQTAMRECLSYTISRLLFLEADTS